MELLLLWYYCHYSLTMGGMLTSEGLPVGWGVPGVDASMITPLGIYQSEQSNAQEFQSTAELACLRPGAVFTKGGEAGEFWRVLFASGFDKTNNWDCACKWWKKVPQGLWSHSSWKLSFLEEWGMQSKSRVGFVPLKLVCNPCLLYWCE